MNLFKHFEILFWSFALLVLALMKPTEPHFSFCLLANTGLTWCPGCGLGRSLSSLLHGDFYTSFKFHWFGLPAFFILVHRIFILSKKYLVYFRN